MTKGCVVSMHPKYPPEIHYIESVLLPKLEHLYNHCGSGILHNVGHHLSILKGYSNILKKVVDSPGIVRTFCLSGEVVTSERVLDILKKHIKTAEELLTQGVKK